MHGSIILIEIDSCVGCSLPLASMSSKLPSGRAGTFFRATYLTLSSIVRSVHGEIISVNCDWASARWVGLVLVFSRYVRWMNSPAKSVRYDRLSVQVSDLKGYEVRFVTTMLEHQTKLQVVLVAVI